jgi:flagellar hook assembly protein FlgD
MTNVRFVLPEADNISLKIYNVIGQEVRTLVDHKLEAGEHKIVWNAAGIPSGVYYYRLSTEDQSRTKRCILLK